MPDNSSNGVRSVCQTSTEKQACEWFVLLRSGSCSGRDICDHDAWMSATSVNRSAYGCLEQLWEQLGCFADMPEIKAACQSLKEDIAKSRTAPATGVDNLHSPQSQTELADSVGCFDKTTWWHSFIVTVFLILSLIAGGQLMQSVWLNEQWLDRPTGSVPQTRIGEKEYVTLVDGSTLVLDTQTTVQDIFSNKTHSLFLEQGQAIFDVMPNPDQPFIVPARNGSVVALGTKFGVKKRGNKVIGDAH